MIEMTKMFFDIETYSTHKEPRLNDKIISIAYKSEDSDINVLKEWETSEKAVLSQFLKEIEDYYKPNLIGHNILKLDIPVIVCRSFENDLGKPDEIYSVFREPYVIDLIQCLLPSNRLYFKGLSLHNCANKLGMEVTGCHNSEIREHYEKGNYDEIIHHNKEDVLITENLYNHLLKCFFHPFDTKSGQRARALE